MSDISRRDFVKTSAKWAALASIPLIFKANPLAALSPGLETDGRLSTYLEHFGVSEEMIRDIMSVALSRGGDHCDVFFQHQISSYIGLEESVVNRAYSTVDLGVGIRVVEGDQIGYSFTEDLTPEAMKAAARTAANIANESASAVLSPLAYNATPDYYPVKTLWEDIGVDEKIPYMETLNNKVLAGDSRIIKSRIGFSDDSSYMLLATSEGQMFCDYKPMCQLSAVCTAEQNGKTEQNYFSLAGRRGIDFFTPANVDRIAQEAVAGTVLLFDAVKPEAGEMEVVLASGQSGILLHEAIGHGMEADCNRKGRSIFSDKIGKPVAEDFVTIIDDGTHMGLRGSINVDDEGTPSQQTLLVENGILKSYMHDLISARHYNVKPTGNGRRQSFRHPILPRMRSTYMLNGPHTKEEIIRSVKKGIYCETFTNGEVAIGPGDFTFYVKVGRLIEDGKITKPIKDINIIGNGPEVLSRITMVADDLSFSEGGGMCGKGGQRVPVSMGLPTVKVSAITVGGVNS